MITTELVAYIKTEIAKGRTREEIHKNLISGGGWTEDDLSEAFKEIIPMPKVVPPIVKPIVPIDSTVPTISASVSTSFAPPATTAPKITPPSFTPVSNFAPKMVPPSFIPPQSSMLVKPAHAPHLFFRFFKFLIIFLIIGGLGLGYWFYRAPINNFIVGSGGVVEKLKGLNLPFLNAKQEVVNPPVKDEPTPPAPPVIKTVKDCGVDTTAILGVPANYDYKTNIVLSCLGQSITNCEDAKGTLNDVFFPTIFEISKIDNNCNFKISYPVDKNLIDPAGNNLALKYISCPVNIVEAPDLTNLAKYANDVYVYGILGVFAKNGLDQSKIQALGCSGDYIDLMIASYQNSPGTVGFNTTISGNKEDLVSLSILPGAKVSGTIKFTGSVKNNYFFEGNIGVNILDANKKLLRNGYANSTSDWMTTEPVSFKGTIDFTSIKKGSVYIQIKNNDPSGLPGRTKTILIPVVVY